MDIACFSQLGLVLCGVHIILQVGSGSSSDLGEFAFIFRISNFGFDFRSFLALFAFDFSS